MAYYLDCDKVVKGVQVPFTGESTCDICGRWLV